MHGINYILLWGLAATLVKGGSLAARQSPTPEDLACLTPCDALDDDLGCESDDAECHCANQQYLETFGECVLENCNETTSQMLLDSVLATCGQFTHEPGTPSDPADDGGLSDIDSASDSLSMESSASSSDEVSSMEGSSETSSTPTPTPTDTPVPPPADTGEPADQTDDEPSSALGQYGVNAARMIGLVTAQLLIRLLL